MWQPITTCPIGPDVLTWDKGRGFVVRRQRMNAGSGGAEFVCWLRGDDYDDGAEEEPPTHWMPLPDAPSDPAHADPTPEQRRQAETWMREVLGDDYDHDDLLDRDGTVLRTPLAEACAEALDLALDDADATIPEWVFDLAHEVGEWWEAEEEDPIITCGCGESGPASVMLDDSGLEETCGGTGYRNCLCGGDSCMCHYHGGTDCDGCEDCAEECAGDNEYPGDREPMEG